MKTVRFIIYGLVCPKTKQIRYIGKSSYGLKRPREHFKPSNYMKQHNHKAHWIKNLIEQGLKPDIVILKEAPTAEELSQLEIDTIKEYRTRYNNDNTLTNSTDGGEGNLGWIPTEETKVNMSKARAEYLSTLTEPMIAINKKEHVVISEVPHKHCPSCDRLMLLVEFTPAKSNWDGLKRICKTCSAEKTRQYRIANPPKKLTPEELKQSYIDRKAAMTAGVNAAYETKPEIKQRISAQNSKAIEGTNIATGEKIYFNSALEAKAAGFQNSNLGQSIRNDVPYRGYTWKFI